MRGSVKFYAKEVYFCSCVTKSDLACTKYSHKFIQQFPQEPHIWKVPRDFHLTPHPLNHLQTVFPHILRWNLFLLLSRHFFFNRQTRNQKFLRTEEVSQNLGTLINKRKKKPPQGKILEFFLINNVTFWMEDVTQGHNDGIFFPKSVHFLPIFKKGQRRPCFLPLSTRCAPVRTLQTPPKR